MKSQRVFVVTLLAASLVIAAILIGRMDKASSKPVAPMRAQSSQQMIATTMPRLSRDLTFVDEDDGSVRVMDTVSEEIVDVIPAGDGAFIRGVLRALVRERRLNGIGDEAPFTLSAEPDGALSLTDSATGHQLLLQAFGATNAAAFAAFLGTAPHTQRVL